MGAKPIRFKRSDLEHVPPDQITIVGLDTDDVAGSHPLWDERAKDPLDPLFVANIAAMGVQSPVACVRRAGRIECVWGRQRVKASRTAGLSTVPVSFLTHKTDKELVALMMVENEVRRDDQLVTKAGKAQRLADLGYKPKEIALMCAVTSQTVRDWFALLKAEPEVLEAAKQNDISDSGAIAIGRLGTREEQLEALSRIVGAGRLLELRRKVGDKTIHDAPVPAPPQGAPAEPSRSTGSAEPSEDDIPDIPEAQAAPPAGGGRKHARVATSDVARTAREVKREAKASAPPAADAEPTEHKRPGVRLASKVVDLAKGNLATIDAGVLLGIRWMLGQIGHKSIKGLTEAITTATQTKK